LVVPRPWHQVIVAPGEYLRRSRDRRQELAQQRVRLGVVTHEPCKLSEASEVAGADVVLVPLTTAGSTSRMGGPSANESQRSVGETVWRIAGSGSVA
jgi:hypothetical protein